MEEVKKIIEHFDLLPHPEGGFYKETYRSLEEAAVDREEPQKVVQRSFATGIYFLLPKGKISTWHRIQSDEMWHFYLGDPMALYQIDPKGQCETIILGSDFVKGQKLQHVVPKGSWFGGHPLEESRYSFVGCTVSPGFDFDDFEMAEHGKLVKLYPEHKEIINRLYPQRQLRSVKI